MSMDLTKGNPLGVILRFTLPLFVGNVFQQLYNMADTIIVGHFVGENALAAVGATGTVMFMCLGVATGLTTGFTVHTSQRCGAGDEKGMKQSAANGILLSVLFSVLITAVSLIFLNPLLHLMNTPDDIYADAYSYISIIIAGTICSVFYNLFSSLLRAVGNSKVPLYFLILSACLNVFLDLLLIAVFQMGTAGAAIATVLSQGISGVLSGIYLWRKVPELWPDHGMWKIRKDIAAKQLSVGVPMALQFGITASGTMVMQTAINLFGATAVAGFTASTKVQNLITQGFSSLGQAMASYVGQNFGAGNLERIRKGVRGCIRTDIVYALAAAVVVNAALEPFMSLFFAAGTDLSQLMPYARTYIFWSSVFYIPLSLIFVFRNTMQGCGYGFLPMLGGVVELVCRAVTAVISMHIMSYTAAVLCDPVAWNGACVFTGIAYLYVMKKVQAVFTPGSEQKG